MKSLPVTAIVYILWSLYITKLVDGNIATILDTPNCSKAILTRAQPNGLYQLWMHRDKPLHFSTKSPESQEIQRACHPDQYGTIGYHYETKTFFTTNIGMKVIEAHDPYPGKYRRRKVFEGISKKVKGLAVDWIHNRVYWADPAYDAIMMTATDESCLVLSKCAQVVIGTGIDNPTGLTVQPFIGRIFWTEGHQLGAANLDGNNRTVLVTGLKEPRGLCIDYNTNRLYWIDQRGESSFIQSADVEGRGLKNITVRPNSSLHDLDIHEGYIVMTDRKWNQLVIHSEHDSKSVQNVRGGTPLGVVIDTKNIRGKVIPEVTRSPSFRGIILLAKKGEIFQMERNFADAKEDSLHPVLMRGGIKVYALTSDAHTHQVYFYDDNSPSIKRVELNVMRGEGEGFDQPKTLTTAVQQVSDLAIDWITKNLYWTDRPNGQIMVSRDSGKYPTVILEKYLEDPRAIAIDPINKFLFWGDGKEIGRAVLDGSHPKYGLYKITHGNHRLAVDPNYRRIYFNDKNMLCYGDYFGQSQCEPMADSTHVSAAGLDIMNDYIIYSDVRGGLFAQDKNDFTDVGKSRSKDIFDDIAFHHASHQPMGQNKCTLKRNGGCEQLCLPNLTQKGYSCACTVGYWSRSDGTCREGQLLEPYLLFTDLHLGRIYQSSLILYMYGMFTLQSLQKPRDVAFDPVEKKIYWTDENLSTINCAYINGSHQHIVYADRNVRPTNIALDVASKLVYFVDAGGNVGAVSVVTAAYQKVLSREVIKAEDIALDPEKGLMFITGQTEVRNITDNTTRRLHCVTMANMDGTNLEQVAVGLGRPTGIIVYKDRVIWTDAELKTMEEVRMWSWNRTVLVDKMRNSPIDLVAHRDYVYWTETGARAILRSSLNDSRKAWESMAGSRFFDLGGLAVAADEFSYSSVCQRHQCHDPVSLCIPTPKGAVCKIPKEKYEIDKCFSGRRDCSTRERHMQKSFCRVPVLANGTIFNVTSNTYVPVNFKIETKCDTGFLLTRAMQLQVSERYIPLKFGENICLSEGKWAEVFTCKWNMKYEIEGTFSRGIVKFYKSSKFLVPPGIWSLDVVCIGGGGGGYNYTDGSDGGESSFDRAPRTRWRSRATGGLHAEGGRGGQRTRGGTGGFGYRYDGGHGGHKNSCHFGGAAGQVRRHLPACNLGVTYCIFCGAGGHGMPTVCRNTSCKVFSGACSGPWARTRTGLDGSDYGGGAGSLTGGSGGAGGFSRKRWMWAKPGNIVPVIVGKGGTPSSARPGDGIVVVAWGDKIENFLGNDTNWRGRCLLENPKCSCIPKDLDTYKQITNNNI